MLIAPLTAASSAIHRNWTNRTISCVLPRDFRAFCVKILRGIVEASTVTVGLLHACILSVAINRNNCLKELKEMKNIGIIGAGAIAGSIAATIQVLDEISAYAIASRDKKKAEKFASQYGFEQAYGSYEELVADERVDFVYIATPHSYHYEHAKLCIKYRKPVLCEKAFTMNAEQAEELFRLAREQSILIAEAMWTRYMPYRKIVDELLQKETIGKVRMLTANIAYKIDDKERVMRPELAGGALLDIGIYLLNFAFMHFGKDYANINSSVVKTNTGVDGQIGIIVEWKDGKLAVLTSSIYGISDRQGVFYGSKGYMIVDNANNPCCISIYDAAHTLVRRVDLPEKITGYEYELLEFVECLEQGRIECESMPHKETLYMMKIMDQLRRKWGVVYPMEERDV